MNALKVGNPLKLCSDLCNKFNKFKNPAFSHPVPFMNGDCYCLKSDQTCAENIYPVCPRNKEIPCQTLSNECTDLSFYVLPYTLPPHGGKKLMEMKIVVTDIKNMSILNVGKKNHHH